LPLGRNLRRGKDYELRFWKDDYWPHTYPLTLRLLSTIKLRRRHQDPSGFLEIAQRVILNFYGPRMQIVDRIAGMDWALKAAIAREEEQPTIPPAHYLVSSEELQSLAPSVNAKKQ
jgi:hypothetical protein